MKGGFFQRRGAAEGVSASAVMPGRPSSARECPPPRRPSGAPVRRRPDNLIDEVDANAVALYDNIDDQGTNGQSKAKVEAGEFVTCQIVDDDAAALVGNAYIYVTTV